MKKMNENKGRKKKNMDVIVLIRTGQMLSQLVSLFFINKCQIALIHSVVLPQIKYCSVFPLHIS